MSKRARWYAGCVEVVTGFKLTPYSLCNLQTASPSLSLSPSHPRPLTLPLSLSLPLSSPLARSSPYTRRGAYSTPLTLSLLSSVPRWNYSTLQGAGRRRRGWEGTERGGWTRCCSDTPWGSNWKRNRKRRSD